MRLVTITKNLVTLDFSPGFYSLRRHCSCVYMEVGRRGLIVTHDITLSIVNDLYQTPPGDLFTLVPVNMVQWGRKTDILSKGCN